MFKNALMILPRQAKDSTWQSQTDSNRRVFARPGARRATPGSDSRGPGCPHEGRRWPQRGLANAVGARSGSDAAGARLAIETGCCAISAALYCRARGGISICAILQSILSRTTAVIRWLAVNFTAVTVSYLCILILCIAYTADHSASHRLRRPLRIRSTASCSFSFSFQLSSFTSGLIDVRHAVVQHLTVDFQRHPPLEGEEPLQDQPR